MAWLALEAEIAREFASDPWAQQIGEWAWWAKAKRAEVYAEAILDGKTHIVGRKAKEKHRAETIPADTRQKEASSYLDRLLAKRRGK